MVWRVVVATDISPEARFALEREGIIHLSGHGGPGYSSSTVVVRASSEDDARTKVAQALELPPEFIREARQPPVWVYAPVDPEDIEGFTRAGLGADGVESVIEHDSPEHRFEVVFELPQGDPDEVFAEARRRYHEICGRAGIRVPDPLELTASGFEVFFAEQQRRDRELLRRAEELFDQGHHDLAVIVAQTACEIVVADAMRTLLDSHASQELLPWLMSRMTSYSLRDDPTRKLWNQLTGTAIQQESWWSNYVGHVGRRNRIVHEGERVDTDAARSSLDAARELFAFIETTMSAE